MTTELQEPIASIEFRCDECEEWVSLGSDHDCISATKHFLGQHRCLQKIEWELLIECEQKEDDHG